MPHANNTNLPPLPPLTLKVAISACLVGQEVRYDGAHKACAQRHVLAQHAVLQPICPEVAIGLGIPRAPIEQRWLNGQLNVVQVDAWQHNSTAALARYAKRIAKQCQEDGISGYVLMHGSPSCALKSGRVHEGAKETSRTAAGFFVHHLQKLLPHLPMTEARTLASPQLLSGFLLQAQLYHRWHTSPPTTAAALWRFHQQHYLQLLATAPQMAAQLNATLLQQPLWPSYLPQALALCAQPSSKAQHQTILSSWLGAPSELPLSALQQAAYQPGLSYFQALPLFNLAWA